MRPLADGSAPEPPEGFTIVVKDNGLMVLRKKRYRDLKKVGIGGFLAKTRTPKGSNKKGENPEDDKKKRVVWKPKKNKILMQYPEYIQDSFFGKDFMGLCPDKLDEEQHLVHADVNKVAKQDSGTSIMLSSSALDALEKMKAKEEAEKKEKEQELEEKRLAAEAAAKEAADKARIAKEELDALKLSGLQQVKDDPDSKNVKDEEMTGEDLMLPTDLFGDDLFKNLMSGGDIDIDESALDNVGDEEANAEADGDGTTQSELAAGLRDMLGDGFDTKDMEDIFKGFADDESKVKTEVKDEPGDELPGDVNETLKNLESQNPNADNSIPTSDQGSLQIKQELMSSAEEINNAAVCASQIITTTANIKTEITSSCSMMSQQPTINTQQNSMMGQQQPQQMSPVVSQHYQQQMGSNAMSPMSQSPMMSPMSQSPMMSPVQQQSPIQQQMTSPVMGGGGPMGGMPPQSYAVSSGQMMTVQQQSPGGPMGVMSSSMQPVSMQQHMNTVVSSGGMIVGQPPMSGMMSPNNPPPGAVIMGPRMSLTQSGGPMVVSSSMSMSAAGGPRMMMSQGPRPMYTGLPPGATVSGGQIMTVTGGMQQPMMQQRPPMMMNPMGGSVVRTVVGQPQPGGGMVVTGNINDCNFLRLNSLKLINVKFKI